MNGVQLFLSRLLPIGACLGACAFTMDAQAHFNAGVCTPQAPVTLSFPPITLPDNLQVGEAIGYPSGYDFASNGFVMQCRYTDWPLLQPVSANLSVVNSPATGMTFNANGLTLPVYATSYPGVGFVMMAGDPSRDFKVITHTGVTLLDAKHNKPNGWGLQGRVYLVATGPITSGTLPGNTVARYVLTNVSIESPGAGSVNFADTVILPPQKPTCRVTTPSLAMPLGLVPNRDFKGVGSHAGSVNRNITLDCAGGTGGNLDVWITVTDQTDPGNRSNQLSLTRDSGARGVALQLLSGDRLVSYGPDASGVGNPNQWQVASTGNGTLTIPLTARYVQTASTIKPGTANGLASFTLSYR
ncbi:fimbrial protein [Pseudomonas khavaziana]|uniref:fimbrial protein n=1 Tax=Pseudomonas khavaziana TaxID=2842351 RepID=UPI001C3C9276|nr:fimbrial protein [Pseudomonas khavaziana]MBV4483614.1 hypothetical protein [Pseudomonas khavaziana]